MKDFQQPKSSCNSEGPPKLSDRLESLSISAFSESI